MQPIPLSTITLQSNTLQYFSNAGTLTHYTKDIVPGQYEGGFKLWECTLDMLQFIETQSSLFEGKRVIEIGCGNGLLGIMASKLGASHVCLQDYNQEVIEKLTKPTVQLNKQQIHKFSFLHGDWQELRCECAKFDVVIGCELIYNQQNYEKIMSVLCQFLKADGVGLLGNKTYYFGVGGNMAAFRKKLENSQKFKCESLLKICPSTGGNKKQIVKVTF